MKKRKKKVLNTILVLLLLIVTFVYQLGFHYTAIVFGFLSLTSMLYYFIKTKVCLFISLLLYMELIDQLVPVAIDNRNLISLIVYVLSFAIYLIYYLNRKKGRLKNDSIRINYNFRNDY